ncbi:hypothetical protein Tco_1197857 [Tanacetum coccineum]
MGGGCGVDGVDGWWLQWCCRWCRSQELTIEDICTESGKTNDESGTPRSQSGWKTSWAKKDDKEDQCASRVEDSSNTNQCAVDGDLRFILKVGSSFCNLE